MLTNFSLFHVFDSAGAVRNCSSCNVLVRQVLVKFIIRWYEVATVGSRGKAYSFTCDWRCWMCHFLWNSWQVGPPIIRDLTFWVSLFQDCRPVAFSSPCSMSCNLALFSTHNFISQQQQQQQESEKWLRNYEPIVTLVHELKIYNV